jgi:hypothetical protein
VRKEGVESLGLARYGYGYCSGRGRVIWELRFRKLKANAWKKRDKVYIALRRGGRGSWGLGRGGRPMKYMAMSTTVGHWAPGQGLEWTLLGGGLLCPSVVRLQR